MTNEIATECQWVCNEKFKVFFITKYTTYFFLKKNFLKTLIIQQFLFKSIGQLKFDSIVSYIFCKSKYYQLVINNIILPLIIHKFKAYYNFLIIYNLSFHYLFKKQVH